MNKNLVQILKFPISRGTESQAADPNTRLIKTKGELATISIDTIRYLAYVEFPENGVPRANHYHKDKLEHLYLIKGKVKLMYRQGGKSNDPIQEAVVEEGSLVTIQPGVAHAYVTLMPGFAVEFSPASYETVKRDQIRDYVTQG